MPTIELKIEDLRFDLKNPRYQNLSNQRDALQKIVDAQDDKLAVLADDIATQGLNPGERIFVTEDEAEGEKYLVLEGNRRLAALMILSRPALLDSLGLRDSQKKRFKDIAKKFRRDAVEPIECMVFDQREEANHWIELRHMGENNGKGIVGWDGIQAARFRGNSVSLQIVDFVKRSGSLDAETLKKLETFPITNLDRLISNPHVREVLGVELANGQIETKLPSNEVNKGLRRVVSDIADKRITVSDIKSKEQREKYIDQLSKSDRPDVTKASKMSKPLASLAVAQGIKQTSSSTQAKRSTRQASDRRTLIPSSCVLKISDPRINAIYKELRMMRVENFPNASAVLLRVFMELTLDHYIGTHGLVVNPTGGRVELAKELKAVADHLQANGIRKGILHPIRVAVSNSSSILSVDTFHHYVHNRHMIPKPVDLNRTWDSIQPFFEKIWS